MFKNRASNIAFIALGLASALGGLWAQSHLQELQRGGDGSTWSVWCAYILIATGVGVAVVGAYKMAARDNDI